MLYFATVPAGLEPLARECLPKGARLVHAGGGAALVEAGSRPAAWPGLYSNVYLVLCQARAADFGPLLRVAEATASTAFFPYTRPNQSFRVRFSRNGRLVNVSGAEMARAEAIVKRAGRFRVDRVKPDLEFWYLLRQDGLGCYALLLTRDRPHVDKGALRPEVAWGMAVFAGVKSGETVLDPFAGSGAIGDAVRRMGAKPLLSDIAPKPGILRCDARALAHVPGRSVDRVVTDPPWGLFEKRDVEALYRDAFREFARVLKPRGTVALLTAAPEAAQAAMADAGFARDKALHLLVNGKKAALERYRLADRA